MSSYEKKADRRLGIQAVEVAARVLEALVTADRPIKLKEAAALASMPAGKIHRYLVSLTRSGLAEQNEETGLYGLGPKAIALGLAGLRTLSVVRAGGDALRAIREQTDETAILAIWSHRGPVIVNLEEGSRPVYMNVRVGSVVPMLKSSVGHVFAAYLPDGFTCALIEAERKALEPGNALRNWHGITHLLAETRKRGLGRVSGNLVPGVNALAAPVFDHTGKLCAAIGALGQPKDLSVDARGPLARALINIAAEYSTRMGANPSALAAGAQPLPRTTRSQ